MAFDFLVYIISQKIYLVTILVCICFCLPERSAHLVIIHTQVILLDAPQPGQTGRVGDLEHARLLALPLDVGRVPLAGVV